MRGGIYVLNFYSAFFIDQLKRGRKTATIRLGDKSNKYERGQVVWITVGLTIYSGLGYAWRHRGLISPNE